ncbi:MAG: hypothetical protein L0229_29165, partial [Blastocatellia bacterium]|nr:hypothetical protein [Blastocatellia bacterium]
GQISSPTVREGTPEKPQEKIKTDGQTGGTNRIVREGIAVEFNILPVGERKPGSAEPLEEEDAIVRFRVTDTAAKSPLGGLRPAAWIGVRGDEETDAKECREKIQSFMRGSLRAQPEVDLNTFYVLTMNRESNIAIIDPLLGFGASKTLAMVFLDNPGEDWVLSEDGKRLFVTVPLSNKVFVAETSRWRTIAKIDAGQRPAKIALQPDQKYLWVGNDSDDPAHSGVTAIDATTLEVVARIQTGTGHHEIAFNADDAWVFVTNESDGTLSIIDAQKLVEVKKIKIGEAATRLAFSPLSHAVYVIDGTGGEIVAIDSRSHEIIARISAKPGLKAIGFARGGRWGFVLNHKENTVSVFDASNNRTVGAEEIGPGPEQLAFTEAFAYIRSSGTEQVHMISLSGLDKSGEIQVTRFPGGQTPPDRATAEVSASAIVPAPEGTAVLLANPGDKMIYYYMEGMAAPMGSFQSYRREPRAVLVVDRSLRESSPGDYSTTIKLPASGSYSVAFLLDTPRITHCFDVKVKPNPALAGRNRGVPLKVQYLNRSAKVEPGKEFNLRFKLTDRRTGEPRADLKDVGILTFLAPGTWQKRQWAKPVGNGIYEVAIVPPKAGVYYVFVHCPSLKVKLNQLPKIVLDGREGGFQKG